MSEERAFLKAIAANPKDDTTRLVFADWLQDRGDPRAEWVRNTEIWKWMKPTGKNPVPKLIAAINGTNWRAQHVLGMLGPAVVPELLGLLPELSDVQAGGVWHALEMIGPQAESVLPRLLAAAKSRRRNVRIGAFKCLSGLARTGTSPEALQQMIAGLEDREPAIRETAMWAVNQAGQAAAEAKDRLVNIVQGGDRRLVESAIETLAQFGPLDRSLIPALVKHLGVSGHSLPERAGKALTGIGLVAVQPILDGSPGTEEEFASGYNYNARRALGEMGPNVIPILREAIVTSKSRATRLLAARTWEWVRYWRPEVDQIPWILEALRLKGERDWSFRSSAFSAIQELGPVAAPTLPLLLELMKDKRPEWSVRASAIEAIAELGPAAAEPAIPALFALLKRPTFPEGCYASRTLARLGRGPSVVVALLGQVKQPKPSDAIHNSLHYLEEQTSEDVVDVRDVIVPAYAAWKDGCTLARPAQLAVKVSPDVITIRAFFKDPSVATRLVTVFALWHIGTAEAVTGLMEALHDRNQVIRRNAVVALGRIGSGRNDVTEAVGAARKDRAKDVRAAAGVAAKQLKRAIPEDRK